ncbi:MAG TPA: sulfite exporter TauE/SafE family protein [Burkholderiales bacterium]|nr:sulfite exporter TauE/SafE family protein [Burkholderiales bacterium]
MIADPWFWALALLAVALTGISKGGTGGGAVVSTPLIALTVPPAQAAAIMLPVLCLMDLAGVRAYFGRWDARIMRILVPAGLLGCVIGALTFRLIHDDWLRVLIGTIALGFLAWSVLPRRAAAQKPGPRAGWFWGTLSGFTSFITHAGGPPVMVYLIPQKLAKDAFVATSLVFFFTLNYAKLLPYFWLGLFDARILLAAALLTPMGVAGIYVGQWLQRRMDVRWFYRVVYTLLLLTGSKLLYDGLTGLFGPG